MAQHPISRAIDGAAKIEFRTEGPHVPARCLSAPAALAVVGVAFLILAAGVPQSADAQSYARTELLQPYVEYHGAGIPMTHVAGDRIDGAFHVSLPFAFPYFGRTHRHVWMSTNGSLLFTDHDLTGHVVAPLVAPVAVAGLRDAIHAVRSDLAAGDARTEAFTAHMADSGSRVVFQFKRVAFAQRERLVDMNFQIHLYANGRIRLWYGPESVVVQEAQGFVSGIVNGDGGESYPGFGNVFSMRTDRPEPNRVIEFTPVAPPAAAPAIGIVPSNRALGSVHVTAGQLDRVVAGFTMHAEGDGGDVNAFTITHPAFAAGDAVTLKLAADAGAIGQFEPGTDAILSQVTVAPHSTTTQLTFPMQTLDATSPTRRYLVLLSVAAVAAPIEGRFGIAGGVSGVNASVPVFGGLRTSPRTITPGPIVDAHVSTSTAGRVARAGDTNVSIANVEFRRRPGTGPTDLTRVDVSLQFAGLTANDISAMRLFLDHGVPGVVDPLDSLLAHGTATAPGVWTFEGFALPVSAQYGFALLAVADLASAIPQTGFVAYQALALHYSHQGTTTHVNGQPESIRVLGTQPRLLLQRNVAHGLETVPAQPGQTNLPANSFTLQTSSGVSGIAALTFTAPSTAGLLAARLFYDNGSNQGRWDPGDTPIGIGQIGPGTIHFQDLASITLDDSPRPFLLVVDFDGGAAAGPRRFDLEAVNVDAALPVSGGMATGTTLNVGTGLIAGGVDVSVTWASNEVSFGGGQVVPLAFVSVFARNGGGFAPSVLFSLVDSAGGVTDGTLRLIPYLSRSGVQVIGPDDTDLIGLDRPLDVLSVVPLTQNVSATVTQSRIYMIGIRRDRLVDGTARIAFRGIVGGTNARIVGWPATHRIALNVHNMEVTTVRPSGGCGATAGGANAVTLLAALALLAAAALVRLRCRRGVLA